jgi:predicted helicase
MSHLLQNSNLGLISLKRARNNFSNKFGIINHIVDKSIVSTLDNGYVFPLYLYPEDSDIFNPTGRKPNLNMEMVEKIAAELGLTFTNEKEETEGTFAPIDILDYIYAVLHSPSYREKYKEFLKIDFPRVPYPDNQETFRQLVKLGGEIRQLHLLESPKVDNYITEYPISGDNIITRKIGKTDWEIIDPANQLGRVWLNDEQYFDKIPVIAWEFYIGGYQPAQKWLKDRQGRELSYEDILHYQKIIVALTETDRLMQEIDQIEFFEK